MRRGKRQHPPNLPGFFALPAHQSEVVRKRVKLIDVIRSGVAGKALQAESPGARPDRKDGAVFTWREAAE